MSHDWVVPSAKRVEMSESDKTEARSFLCSTDIPACLVYRSNSYFLFVGIDGLSVGAMMMGMERSTSYVTVILCVAYDTDSVAVDIFQFGPSLLAVH